MKDLKKILITMTLTVSMLLLLTGCGTQKITPEESGKMFYEVGAHQDGTKLKELLGDNASEFDDMLSDEVSEAKKSASSMMSSSGLNLTDDELNDYLDAYLGALKRMECKNVTVVSQSDDEAELEFEVTCADITSMYKEIQQELQDTYLAKVKNGQYTRDTYSKMEKDMIKDCMNMLITKLNNCTGTSETTFKYTFNKRVYDNGLLSKKEIWMPKGNTAFGMEVAKASFALNSSNKLGNIE